MDRLLASILLLKWKPINRGNVCLWRSLWARRQWRVHLSWSKHTLVFRRLTVSWTHEPNISLSVTFLLTFFFFAWIFYVCPSLTPLFVFYSIYLILSTVFFLSLFLLVFCFLLTLSSWHWLGYRVTLICEKSFRQSWNIKFKSYSTTSLLFLSRSLSLSLSRFPSRFSVSFLAFSLFALHFISWNKLQPRIIHTGWVY